MNKLDKFTFLIPIFNLKDERFENFKFVLSKILEITDKVLVVEQVRDRRKATNAKRYAKKLGARYLSIKVIDDQIHKSKLINIGTEKINTDYVWVNDSDCYLKFQKVIDQLDFRHNFIQPYSIAKYISKEETDKIFNGESIQVEYCYKKDKERIVPGTLYYVAMYGALSFLFKQRDFKEVGRMNECYAGWGLEDNSICMRVFQYEKLLFDIINIPGIHLFHPRYSYDDQTKLADSSISVNTKIYEKEFKKSCDVLNDQLRKFYEKYFAKKISILGIERSGTALLAESISSLFKLTRYNEPFHRATLSDNNINKIENFDDYLNFYIQKSNYCIKHLDTPSECSDIFNMPQNEYRAAIKESIIKNSSELIITTRNNFLDWITSFSIAFKNKQWYNTEYTGVVHILKQEFEWMFDHWHTYHTIHLNDTIRICKLYNKAYKIIDYDELSQEGDFVDIGLNVTYKDILNIATTKKQKTKQNSDYILNYDDVQKWYLDKMNTIFIMTRFSHSCSDLDYFKNTEWLDQRIKLFDYNFKSIQSQTYKNFKWIISVHPETHHSAIEQLEQYKLQLPQIEIMYTTANIWGGGQYVNDALKIINNNIESDDTYITLWHDSDDMLLYDTVLEELAASLATSPEGTIGLSTIEGYASVPNLASSNIRYKTRPMTTFIALKSSSAQQKTIFDRGHVKWINDSNCNYVYLPNRARHLKIESDYSLTNGTTTLSALVKKQHYFTDKFTVHCYIDKFYNSSFRIGRKLAKTILEIGVFRGGSIKLWRDYFERATIYGIDLDLSKLKYDFSSDLRVKLIEQSIYSDTILNDLPPQFDYIIDDASHTVKDQIYAFNKFFPLLKKGGMYVIEDIQNIDRDKQLFTSLANEVNIYDFRHVNNRYDDVIVKIIK